MNNETTGNAAHDPGIPSGPGIFPMLNNLDNLSFIESFNQGVVVISDGIIVMASNAAAKQILPALKAGTHCFIGFCVSGRVRWKCRWCRSE